MACFIAMALCYLEKWQPLAPGRFEHRKLGTIIYLKGGQGGLFLPMKASETLNF